MEKNAKLIGLKNHLTHEVASSLEVDDSWLMVSLSTSDKGKVMLSPDTIFHGFEGSRELRGPRWRSLESSRSFSDIGYGYVVAGNLGMSILAKLIEAKKVPKGVIVHKTAIETWFPEMGEVRPALNSIKGFLDPSSHKNRSLAAKRPNSTRRKSLKAGKTCFFCETKEELTLHHIIRRELGGATEDDNLLVVCRDCHDLIHDGKIDDKHLILEMGIKRSEYLFREITDDKK